MKKALYLIAALSLAASSAMASKARQAALSNTTAITDIQSIFLNPADVNYVGDFATFEMGAANTVGGAEGGFLKTMGDAKLGFYLGKTSSLVNTHRTAAGTAASVTFLKNENPFEVFYGAKAGDMNWGFSFNYSNSDKKQDPSLTTDDTKQSGYGVRLGVKTDMWGAYANIGLGSEAKVGDAKYTGKSGTTIGGHYLKDTMKFVARYDMFGAKAKNAAGSDVYDNDYTVMTLGFTNAWKSEGSMAFYGLAYKVTNDKTKTTSEVKTDKQEMPFTIGAEVLATSWLKLRGSVTQNFFMGSTKTGSNGADSLSHNTTSAAGAGFVWGKNNLDMVLTMGTDGVLNASTFGTTASYTYMF